MSDMNVGKIGQAKYYEFSSGAAEGSIGFGKGVVKGTNPETQFKEFDGSADTLKVAGFAAFTLSGDIDNFKFEDKQPMRVLRQGVVAVKVSATASNSPKAGDTVALAPNGDVITAAEAESNSGTGGSYAATLKNSEFIEGGDAGDTVLVEVDFPTEVVFTEQA